MATIHIPEAEAARNFAAVMAHVRAGTEVVIEGYRAKNGTATLNGRSVKLPDGRNLFTGGSAPDEQPQP